MGFKKVIFNKSGSQFAYVSVLLPNGKVLNVFESGATYLFEPDEYGSYVNGTSRRIEDCPYTYLYSTITLNKNGTVSIHPGEYGTGHTLSEVVTGGYFGFVSTFDPVRETWSSERGGFPYHSFVFLSDDGRYMTPDYTFDPNVSYLHTNRIDSPIAGINESFKLSEAGAALDPEGIGTFFVANAPNNTLVNNWCIISPGYDSTMEAGGSSTFEGLVTNGLTWGNGGIAAINNGYWRLPNDSTRGRWTSIGRIDYEVGPNIYMPKINKFVFLSGVGIIYTLPLGYGNTQIQRTAEMGMEPLWPTPGNRSLHLGTVKAANNGQLPSAAIASGTFTFQGQALSQDYTVALQAGSLDGATYKRIFVRIDNNTKWFAIDYVSASFSGNDITLTGCTFGSFPGATWTGNTLSTGDQICRGRPSYDVQDGACAFLPNGDLMFSAGGEVYHQGGYFNETSTILKWNGTSSVAEKVNFEEQFEIGGYQAGDYTRLLIPLPDGSMFIRGNTSIIYTPTTIEATPMPGSRPAITGSPSSVRAGRKFTVSGNQLNGIHEGALQGDDWQPRTNFPIIRLTNTETNKVYYCRSRDFTYRGIRPNRPSTVGVHVPSDVPGGMYTLESVASGVASTPVSIEILPSIEGDPVFINSYR